MFRVIEECLKGCLRVYGLQVLLGYRFVKLRPFLLTI